MTLRRDQIEGVEGWLSFAEAMALYRMVVDHPTPGPITVVEIGSWKGRSTIALAQAVKDRPSGGLVHAIDPHTGSEEHHREFGKVDTFDEFRQNIEGARVADLVHPIREFSTDAARQFEPQCVHALFVDGAHDYTNVRRDVSDWLPRLANRSHVAFNDVNWLGVFRALQGGVIRGDASFSKPSIVDHTLYYERQCDRLSTANDRRTAALFRLRLSGYFIQQGTMPIVRGKLDRLRTRT
jgi:predicted O-methyltransferase YrrM